MKNDNKRPALRMVKDMPLEEKRARKNAMDRERRRLAREGGKTDMRGKHPRTVKIKPKVLRKVEELPAVKIKAKPRAFLTREIDLNKCVPIHLDSKTVVYVKPGSDVNAIINRFQNRSK